MVDAWGGWSQFQALLKTLKNVASKHGVSIPTVAVKYILDQVKSIFPLDNRSDSILTSNYLH
jgi:aryl-alcohol dehydrogenase-like predicted oxidoreductase